MILALDLGSSTFKAGLFDPDLRQLDAAESEVGYRRAEGGSVELDVAEAEAMVRRIVITCLSGRGNEDLEAIAVTSQAQTFTVSGPDGVPRLPFISWQDTRAVSACESLRRLPSLERFGAYSSFGRIVPALMMCQLRRIADTAPTILAGPNSIVPLPSHFVQRWSGRLITDDNLAGMSGLYDIDNRRWEPESLRAVRVSPQQMPDVLPIGGALVTAAAGAGQYGLPAGIPIVLAGNDQTAGAFGAHLERDGSMLLTLGTAHVAYVTREALPSPEPGLIRGPYPSGGFYSMAAEAGGNIVSWARTVLAGCREESQFESAAAAASAGCRGASFTPDITEEKGSWAGLGLHHGPADLARAVIEALAQKAAGMVRSLAGGYQKELLVAGGGAGSDVLCSTIASIAGVTLRKTDATPLVGAARMAVAALRTLRGNRS